MTAAVPVVGGGLAGLLAATHLADGGVDVTLYERRASVGGRVRTTMRDGYWLDHGFQVLFTAYPAVERELDLEALDLRRFSPGAVLARPGQRSILADPLREPQAVLDSLFTTDVTLRDKLRVLWLRRELSRLEFDAIFQRPDQSIRSALRDRGFSERFLEHFAAPFYGGITLDRSLSSSNRIFEYTFKTLAAGSIAVPSAGMGAIPAQLAEQARDAGVTLEMSTTVDAVEPTDDGVTLVADGETRTVDAAVVATDPPTARELTGLESIPTEGVGCVTQYYRLPAERALETGKRLVLNTTDDGPNHVVPHSEVVPASAPDGEALLSGTYLGDPAADDEQLAQQTKRTLEAWYPERSFGGLEVIHTDRIPFAQFAQPPGIHDELPTVRAPGNGIYLAGEYTHWSSIQGAMASGAEAAAAVLAHLE